ncbi:hypothetical protein ERO13_A10G240201v2 [Gossypium hirsutum]|nr:hypothetical protein ERO13_A10G240201v2 [Gossypium hirsutum]
MFTFMPWSKRTHTGGRLNLKTRSRCKRVTSALTPQSKLNLDTGRKTGRVSNREQNRNVLGAANASSSA